MHAKSCIVVILGHGWEVGVVIRFGIVLHFQHVEQRFQVVRLVVADLLWIVVAKILADLGDRGVNLTGGPGKEGRLESRLFRGSQSFRLAARAGKLQRSCPLCARQQELLALRDAPDTGVVQ